MHTIRLRGPWRVRPLVAFVRRDSRWSVVDSNGAEATVDLNRLWPEALALAAPAGFRGRVAWSRTFHAPTGITPTDRVALAIRAPGATIAASLNGRPLDLREDETAARVDIGPMLLATNQLEIVVEAPWFPGLRDEDASPPTMAELVLGFEVALEIESP